MSHAGLETDTTGTDVCFTPRKADIGRNLATTLGLSTDNINRMDPQMDKLSAAGLVRAYRRRELSPVEVTQAVLQRIERLNPHYNAFCLVDADEALRSAMRSEERWQKKEPLSFIDGVPATIKDLVLTKGWPTLRGSRTVDASQSWDEDAPATQRLREAGAVLLG